MSFPEYLKDRISEDYKNLMIQKLQEIKDQSEGLKNAFHPSIAEMNQSLRDLLQRELIRIQEAFDHKLDGIHEKIAKEFEGVLENYISSWYHTDVTPFHQQMELLISDVVSNVPAPPKEESADIASLVDLARNLEQAGTQAEILQVLLQHIASWADRAILFVIKGDQASGWAALGLGTDWDASRIRQIKIDLSKDLILRDVISTGEAVYGKADSQPANQELFEAIGDHTPKTALAVPVIVRGKIAGILYVDLESDLSEQPDVPNLLILASRAAGAAIDLLPTRAKAAPAASPAAPETAKFEVPAPPQPASTAVQEEVAEPAPQAPTEEVEVEVEDVRGLIPEQTNEEEVAEPAPIEGSEPTLILPLHFKEISPEDLQLHEDAKRFARLLVSEIKLYNEAQVSAGRENKDLYERLKDDIELSRKTYSERVPEHIHSSTNYFYEELVRTLANGDPALLGM
jgi:hypothetical protein